MLTGKSLFKFLDNAKTALGIITLKKYINNSPTVQSRTSANSDDLNSSPSLAEKLSCLMHNQLLELINKGLSLLGSNVNLAELLIEFRQKQNDTALTITEQLYSWKILFHETCHGKKISSKKSVRFFTEKLW